MEMPWTGDVDGLIALPGAEINGAGAGGGNGVRLKDRMSYRHLAYQIDLTQVTDVGFSLLLFIITFLFFIFYFYYNLLSRLLVFEVGVLTVS